MQLNATPDKAGKNSRCPLCNKVIVIPPPPTAPVAPVPADDIPIEVGAPPPPPTPPPPERLEFEDDSDNTATGGSAADLPDAHRTTKEFSRRVRVVTKPLPRLPVYGAVLMGASGALAAIGCGLGVLRVAPDAKVIDRLPTIIQFIPQALANSAWAVGLCASIALLWGLLEVTAYVQAGALKDRPSPARAIWYRLTEWIAWGWLALVAVGALIVALWLRANGEASSAMLWLPGLFLLFWVMLHPAAQLLALGGIRTLVAPARGIRRGLSLTVGAPLYFSGLVGRTVGAWAPVALVAAGMLSTGHTPVQTVLAVLPLLGLFGLLSLSRLKGGLGEAELYQQAPFYLAMLVGLAVVAIQGGDAVDVVLLRVGKLAAAGLVVDSMATLALALPGSMLFTLYCASNFARGKSSARLFYAAPTPYLAESAGRTVVVLGICTAGIIGLGAYRGVSVYALVTVGLMAGAIILRALAHIQAASAHADIQRHFETLEP